MEKALISYTIHGDQTVPSTYVVIHSSKNIIIFLENYNEFLNLWTNIFL